MTVEVIRSNEWRVLVTDASKQPVLELRGHKATVEPALIYVATFPDDEGSLPPIPVEDVVKAVALAKQLSGYKPKRGKK